VKALKNHINHLFVSHEIAKQTISDAQKKFEDTKALAVSDFEKVKQNTLEKTEKAVFELYDSIIDEDHEVETTYQTAKDAISNKRSIVETLHEEINHVKASDLTIN
jgi:vacuolar-type H+-ATPase subunit H